MVIAGVATPTPPGKGVCQHSQIQINQNQIQTPLAKIKSKKEIRERPIRGKSVISVFLFLICVHAEGRGHNANTE